MSPSSAEAVLAKVSVPRLEGPRCLTDARPLARLKSRSTSRVSRSRAPSKQAPVRSAPPRCGDAVALADKALNLPNSSMRTASGTKAETRLGKARVEDR